MHSEIFRKTVRSFVRRQGRLTAGQKKALDDYSQKYLLPFRPETLVIANLFSEPNPLWVEVGFGSGETLAHLAHTNPHINFWGMEVHTPGVGRLLNVLHEQASENVRLSHHDAIEVLKSQLPDRSIDRCLILFPDPWHKKRHHKRRLIQADFVELLSRKLKPQGILHLATDWEPYAEQMLATLNASHGFKNLAASSGYSKPPDYRIETRFERRGKNLGHQVWDLLFTRTATEQR